jgi:hypothetical protein
MSERDALIERIIPGALAALPAARPPRPRRQAEPQPEPDPIPATITDVKELIRYIAPAIAAALGDWWRDPDEQQRIMLTNAQGYWLRLAKHWRTERLIVTAYFDRQHSMDTLKYKDNLTTTEITLDPRRPQRALAADIQRRILTDYAALFAQIAEQQRIQAEKDAYQQAVYGALLALFPREALYQSRNTDHKFTYHHDRVRYCDADVSVNGRGQVDINLSYLTLEEAHALLCCLRDHTPSSV